VGQRLDEKRVCQQTPDQRDVFRCRLDKPVGSPQDSFATLQIWDIPVVAATGGLNDTVIGATPASLSANAATGVTFHPIDNLALSSALRRLVALYEDRAAWSRLVKRAMRFAVSWDQPAKAYAALYRSLVG